MDRSSPARHGHWILGECRAGRPDKQGSGQDRTTESGTRLVVITFSFI